ncbi:MAG: hypothetical protein ABR498_03875 [Candidatus Dormibacteria bacterium]
MAKTRNGMAERRTPERRVAPARVSQQLENRALVLCGGGITGLTYE